MKFSRNLNREKKERWYPKIEAMYRKGMSNEEIIKESELSRIETLEIIQHIFGRDMMKKEQEEETRRKTRRNFRKNY